MFRIFCFLLCFAVSESITKNKCIPRDYGYGSNVCVCSGSYCDTLPGIEPMPTGGAVVFTSSKAGLRFEKTVTNWINASSEQVASANLTVDVSQQFQKIIGFGGAFTDAFGFNIKNLSNLAVDYLLSSYFGEGGIGYNIGRIPIASCDFSIRNYSYDDVVDDFDLVNFSLAYEDTHYKIPYIKQAMYMSSTRIKFFGSSWSAPFWMKTNQMMQGNGTIIGKPGEKYYKTWANYYIKFLEAYAKEGVNIWGLTGQNEPTTGFIYNYKWQTTGFTPELQRDFIKMDLGPALANSSFSNVKLMILDDQRFMLPTWANVVLNDSDAAKYIFGVAVHWYGDKYTPVQVLDETHDNFLTFPLFGTEACAGEIGNKVELGSWTRGESYAKDIIENLNHWYTGWTDWNLALDPQGGPNWVGNYVDSAIIVNISSGEFYKQPMFYAMGHVSAFLPPDSVRVGLTSNMSTYFSKKNIIATAFQSPKGYKVLILLNKNPKPFSFTLAEKSGNSILPINMPANSIQTILWT